jgi:hypothetical protein
LRCSHRRQLAQASSNDAAPRLFVSFAFCFFVYFHPNFEYGCVTTILRLRRLFLYLLFDHRSRPVQVCRSFASLTAVSLTTASFSNLFFVCRPRPSIAPTATAPDTRSRRMMHPLRADALYAARAAYAAMCDSRSTCALAWRLILRWCSRGYSLLSILCLLLISRAVVEVGRARCPMWLSC